MRAWALTGLPRKTSRGTSGGSSERAAAGASAAMATAARLRSEGMRCGVLTEHLRKEWGRGPVKRGKRYHRQHRKVVGRGLSMAAFVTPQGAAVAGKGRE